MAATVPLYARPEIVLGEQCAEAPLSGRGQAHQPTRNCSYANGLLTPVLWRSGGGAEPQPGSVGQPDDSLGPKDRRQGLQQGGHPAGRDDRGPVGLDAAPGDAGPMHGDDRGDLDLGDAEDLVGLVGLPPDLAQGGEERVAAVAGDGGG